ncbi:MAG: protein kinase [Candidatus Symbiothrix sp.]|jgi:serine/threonine protein kinase|nr:protein kinase [Candidatus Symbiothrix sp.]
MGTVVQRCDFGKGDRIGGKYRVENELGEGSFGKVFKVKDSKGDIYALKLLKLWEVHPDIRQQLVDRFDMEFETGRISSNYLVHSLDHGLVEGNPYIVMEFCPGGDLLQLRNPDLTKIGKQVLYGLKDLHACGKVHRDLKPENVLLREDGSAVLTDFGISGDRNKRMTERNIMGKPTQIFGTYAYMPPEQVKPKRGDATVLPTTDIFSFGVMMYQLITGKLPFGELNNENDVVLYIRNGENGNWNRTLLQKRNVAFCKVIEGCLMPDYKERLPTIDKVLELMPDDSKNINSSYKPTYNDNAPQMSIHNGVLLRIMQGEEYGRTYKLDELLHGGRRVITVGRQDASVNNLLPVREEESCYISRKHCTLEVDFSTGQWYIRDGQWDRAATDNWKHSLNGTYVNSTEVTGYGIVFRPGDIISIGDVKLRVEGY